VARTRAAIAPPLRIATLPPLDAAVIGVIEARVMETGESLPSAGLSTSVRYQLLVGGEVNAAGEDADRPAHGRTGAAAATAIGSRQPRRHQPAVGSQAHRAAERQPTLAHRVHRSHGR